ncbi:inositol-pentakisphosphate 2-kinase, partial [Opisthorchis viverrini]
MDVRCCFTPVDTNLPPETTNPLPGNLQVYTNQVGGHGMFGNKGRMLHSPALGAVYKPVQKYPKGPHEVDFYRLLFNPDCEDSVFLQLRPFLPKYRGLYHHPSSKALYLGMSDVLEQLKHPSICDIKIGRNTYAPDASAKKIAVEKAKYKWQAELGFLISAIRVVDSSDDLRPVYIDRTFGRSLSPSTVYDHGIRVFLGPNMKRSRSLARRFVTQLNKLSEWFEQQDKLSFYASSLLLAYDSHQDDLHSEPTLTSSSFSDAGEEHDNDELVVTYLIDFARWRPLESGAGSRDENFLYGLRNLIQLFQRVSAETAPLQLSVQQFSFRNSKDLISGLPPTPL